MYSACRIEVNLVKLENFQIRFSSVHKIQIATPARRTQSLFTCRNRRFVEVPSDVKGQSSQTRPEPQEAKKNLQ